MGAGRGGEAQRAHNASDGRCRYTFGRERCPAPGSIAVGHWFVCAEHRVWAESPGDPLMQADGRRALRVQQARYEAQEAIGDTVDTREAPEPATSPQAALRDLAGILGVDLERKRADRRQRIEAGAERMFLRAVREKGSRGDDSAKRAAILAAVRDVAVAAAEGRLDNG